MKSPIHNHFVLIGDIAIDSLSTLSQAADPDVIIELLDELIPGSSIRDASHPDITSMI
jgi:hypothetical protein